MKKILMLMMTASLVMISGCKKGLDPQIYGSLSTTNFPKTEADFVNYVAEVYKPFQSKWGYTEPAPLGYQNDWFSPEYGDIMMFDLPTDEFNTYTNWGGIFQQFSSANFTFLINQGTADNHFEKIRFVSRLTQIIDDVNKSTISTASKKTFTAEARMSRGWNMYYLLQLYGPVPVILDPALINTDAELNLTRPSRADFLASIVSDLTYAAANLPVTPADYGRFNQSIALTVLMRTYMNEKDFVNAEKIGRQIITLANTAGYRLVDDYASMFTEAGELNTETMFAISCAPNQDGAENHANFNAWDFYTYPNGYPGNSIQNSYAGYRIPAPISATWSFYNSFDPADKRRKLLIASYVDKWDHTVMNQASGLAGPVVAKYPDNGTVANSAQGNDIPKARLGDVYLMLAEAINQNSGPTSEAVGYVNQVRLHHGGLGVVPAANTVDKPTFDTWILKEEGWETYFEGYRKMDLVRHGQWPAALPADKNHGPYLFPVPTYEITAGKGKLTQTPGYN